MDQLTNLFENTSFHLEDSCNSNSNNNKDLNVVNYPNNNKLALQRKTQVKEESNNDLYYDNTPKTNLLSKNEIVKLLNAQNEELNRKRRLKEIKKNNWKSIPDNYEFNTITKQFEKSNSLIEEAIQNENYSVKYNTSNANMHFNNIFQLQKLNKTPQANNIPNSTVKETICEKGTVSVKNKVAINEHLYTKKHHGKNKYHEKLFKQPNKQRNRDQIYQGVNKAQQFSSPIKTPCRSSKTDSFLSLTQQQSSQYSPVSSMINCTFRKQNKTKKPYDHYTVYNNKPSSSKSLSIDSIKDQSKDIPNSRSQSLNLRKCISLLKQPRISHCLNAHREINMKQQFDSLNQFFIQFDTDCRTPFNKIFKRCNTIFNNKQKNITENELKQLLTQIIKPATCKYNAKNIKAYQYGFFYFLVLYKTLFSCISNSNSSRYNAPSENNWIEFDINVFPVNKNNKQLSRSSSTSSIIHYCNDKLMKNLAVEEPKTMQLAKREIKKMLQQDLFYQTILAQMKDYSSQNRNEKALLVFHSGKVLSELKKQLLPDQLIYKSQYIAVYLYYDSIKCKFDIKKEYFNCIDLD